MRYRWIRPGVAALACCALLLLGVACSSPAEGLQEDLEIAKAAERAGDYDRARSHYRKVLKVASRHPDALHGLGEDALRQGRLDSAFDYFTRAVKSDPGRPRNTAWRRLLPGAMRARAGSPPNLGLSRFGLQRLLSRRRRPAAVAALSATAATMTRTSQIAAAIHPDTRNSSISLAMNHTPQAQKAGGKSTPSSVGTPPAFSGLSPTLYATRSLTVR